MVVICDNSYKEARGFKYFWKEHFSNSTEFKD